MKKVIAVFLWFVIFHGKVFCQTARQLNIPSFQPTPIEKRDSIQLKKLWALTSEYDFSLTLMSDCYWYRATPYEVLGFKNGQWKQFSLYTDFRNKHHDIIKGKTRIVNKEADQHLCDSVWNLLCNSKLFSFNRDSLNIRMKTFSNDSVFPSVTKDESGNYQITVAAKHTRSESLGISDGTYYEFIINTKNKVRVTGSYEPKRYSEWLPEVDELKRFVYCKDLFEKLW